MARPTCSICCNAAKLVVKCNHCDLEACQTCIKRYVAEDSSLHVRCMGCRKTWNREFLVDHFPMAWINGDLKKHQEALMMDTEKSLLPSTQGVVKQTLKERKLRDVLKEQRKKRSELTHQLAQIREDIVKTEVALYRLPRNAEQSEAVTSVYGACPEKECKGFLGQDWCCQLCNAKVCSKCSMRVVGTTHECKPEDVETTKFLKKDAKPCPSCAALCHKVDGCSQVFCVNCKTAFNYNTLRIENTYIHAPDYYRWIRDNGGEVPRAPGDAGGCAQDRNVSLMRLRTKFRDPNLTKSTVTNIFYDVHRVMSHVRAVELDRYRINVMQDNVDIRVEYMLNEIDETKWKRLLQQRMKSRDKKQEIYAVLQTFITVANDMFHRVLTVGSEGELSVLFNEFEQLRQYINDRMRKVSTIYNCVVPYLAVDWSCVRTQKSLEV